MTIITRRGHVVSIGGLGNSRVVQVVFEPYWTHKRFDLTFNPHGVVEGDIVDVTFDNLTDVATGLVKVVI